METARALDETTAIVRKHLERLDRCIADVKARTYTPQRLVEDCSWYGLQVTDDVPRVMRAWLDAMSSMMPR